MYCPYCGAFLEEGVKFCPNCGVSLSEQGLTGLQNESAVSSPLYEQPVVPAAAPRSKRLIAPAIVAIVSAGQMLILWAANFEFISKLAGGLSNKRFFVSNLYILIRLSIGPLLSALAGVFLFLFGVVQYRKGKTSFLGLSCLMALFSFILALLSYPIVAAEAISAEISNRLESIFSGVGLVNLILDIAISVLLLICAIGAFMRKPNKIVLIVTGSLLMLHEVIDFTTRVQTMQVSDTFGILAGVLLAAAVLLTGILWRPVKTE